MHPFANAFIGGCLIGLAAVCLMRGTGRILGASGITFGALLNSDRSWRIVFLVGLTASFPIYRLFVPTVTVNGLSHNAGLLVVAGLLVGIGSSLGSGCTSGHGICGISRLSMRSIIATCTFMVTAIITVYITRHVVQGAG